MPRPGSKSYDDKKSQIRHELEGEGIKDDAAAESAHEAMDAAEDPDGRKHVNASASGGGTRQGSPWPDRPTKGAK